MKTVKLLGICLLSLVITAGLSSCGEDEYASRLKELIMKNTLTFGPDDQEGSLSHTTTFRNEDLSNYRAVSDASWCQVYIDVENAQMTVSVEQNESFDEREATVTLTDIQAPEISRFFKVVQKQNNVLRVSKSTYAVGTDGGFFEIEFEHNVDDCEISCNASWVKYGLKSNTRGLKTSIINVSVDENDSGAARTAFITIESETVGDSETCRIDQEYVQKEFFNLPTTDFTIDELGGTINVNAQSNKTQFDIFPPEDSWATLGELQFLTALSVVTQVINVTPFTDKEPSRTTRFYWEDETVTITQYRKLYIIDSDFTLTQQDTKTVSVNNVDGVSMKWSSSDEKVATVDANGLVTAVAPGEATITVASSDGRHKDTVKVTVEKPQDLRNFFSIEWQPYYEVVSGEKTISSLSCTLNNESSRTIVLTKCEIYCDLKFLSNMEYSSKSGTLAPNESKKVTFDNLAGKADKFGFTVIWYYTFNGESFEYRCEYTDW